MRVICEAWPSTRLLTKSSAFLASLRAKADLFGDCLATAETASQPESAGGVAVGKWAATEITEVGGEHAAEDDSVRADLRSELLIRVRVPVVQSSGAEGLTGPAVAKHGPESLAPAVGASETQKLTSELPALK